MKSKDSLSALSEDAARLKAQLVPAARPMIAMGGMLLIVGLARYAGPYAAGAIVLLAGAGTFLWNRADR